MNVSPTYVRIGMVCAIFCGMLIAAMEIGLISSGEHSIALLYWILMPTIWLVQKMPAGVLANTSLYLIAGFNVNLIFWSIYGVSKAIRRIKERSPRQQPAQPPRPTGG